MRNKSPIRPSLGRTVAAISLVFCVYAGIVCSATLPLGAQETRPPTETPTGTTEPLTGRTETPTAWNESRPNAVLDTRLWLPAHVIVILLIALLVLLFWLLLRWSQKSEQAAYLGQVYLDTVEQFEYNRLLVPFRQKRDRGEYEREVANDWMRKHPPTPAPEPEEDLVRYLPRYVRRGISIGRETEPPGLPGLYYGGGGWNPGGGQIPGTPMPGSPDPWDDGEWSSSGPQDERGESLPEETKKKRSAFLKEYHKWDKKSREWLAEFHGAVEQRYQQDSKLVRNQAKKTLNEQ